MTDLKLIKEANIYKEDGVLHIEFGDIEKNSKFHDRVSIEYQNGGGELLVKGHKVAYDELIGVVYEGDKGFNYFCDNLMAFKENIVVVKKFSWKKFKFESVRCVINSSYGKYYRIIPKFWNLYEYKVNNWVITEKKETV